MMLIKTRRISDYYSTWNGLQHIAKPHYRPQNLLKNPPSNLVIFNLKEKQGFQALSSHTKLQKCDKNKRDFAVCSGVEPGVPPSGPPNIASWIVAVAIAIVVPLIGYKWGPTLKSKVETALQTTEDVAEAVEKVAEQVEKVAEDIAGGLPEGGKFRKAVDFVENVAERAAKEAGAVDDFIDKVQDEEEKAESFAESLNDESKKPPEKEPKDEISNDQKSNE